MAAIYDKALKRKDFSGIIDSDKDKTTEDKKDATTANGTGNFILISCLLYPNARPARQREDQAKEDEKGDDPKAGADVGKIVNLMAGDANKVSSGFSFSYVPNFWPRSRIWSPGRTIYMAVCIHHPVSKRCTD